MHKTVSVLNKKKLSHRLVGVNAGWSSNDRALKKRTCLHKASKLELRGTRAETEAEVRLFAFYKGTARVLRGRKLLTGRNASARADLNE